MLFVVVAACSAPPAPRQAGRQDGAGIDFSVPAPTDRTTVQVGAIDRQISLDGRIVPRDSTTVRAPSPGTVTSLDVLQGDAVAVGDLLATIDLGDAISVAILELKLAMSERDLALATGAASGTLDEFDQRVSDAEQALDDLGVDRSLIDLDAAELGAIEVRSQRSGVVVSTTARFGQSITDGDPIVVIGDPADLIAFATTSPSQFESIALGMDTTIVASGALDQTTTGVVTERSRATAGDGSGAVGRTGSSVTVDFNTSDFTASDSTTSTDAESSVDQPFELGTRIEITIVLESVAEVLWLRPDAVRGQGDAQFVIVEREDRQVRVAVETGLRTDDRIEIVQPSGLAAGDTVVMP